jgi:hypothetical protein
LSPFTLSFGSNTAHFHTAGVTGSIPVPPTIKSRCIPAHERRIFAEFCAASGLAPDSITQPDPPDIIAELDGHGRVAFELVRVNHADEILSMNLMVESTYFLAEQFTQRPAPQHARLSAMYADAHVLLQFSPTANPGQRKQALPFVWTLLESRAAGAKGYLFKSSTWLATCVPSHLDMVYVSRFPGLTGGPQFNTQSANYVYPIQIARVIDKLWKPYRCAEPLELVAYADRGEFSLVRDLPELGEAVRSQLPGSAFRRVWAFEEMQRRVTLIGEI